MSNLIGQSLGPYRIIEQIGIGGMATVYKAYQPSMDRYVAVKVLPAVLARDPAFLKRFRREAKVVAKLEHKHILPVYDYGEQEGLTYLVMRYVEAGTLKDRLAAGQLDLPEIYRTIAQVGSALDYAHRLGVIHRDVKPSNVLIDSQGDAYLTDFGLARIVESSEQLTATGVGVGTPAYMAPEQGQGLKIDHRSDVYSLGVMLYEMVTGRVPYQAETPMAVVIKHITEPLPLPRQIMPDLPEEVERVVLKALAKKPEDRFQTVREMVEALDFAVRAAVAAEPAAARAEREAIPPAPAAPGRKFRWPWDARTTAIGVGIAALALLVIGGLFFALSRVQYRVQIVGGRVEVVPVGTETVVPAETPTGAVVAATAMAAATPQPTAATSPTPTRTKLPPGYASPGDPPDEGRVVEYCENVGLGTGLCIFPYKGGAHTTILEDAGLYFDKDGSLSWNPNGQRIAFAAATAPDEHPDIYTVNADGSDMTSITFDDEVNHNPAWSPDDEWIAFQRNGDLAIVRPDGSDLTVIQRQISDGPCFAAPHWSPDSQWIAVYAMVNGCPPTSPLTREVWIISRDGQTVNVVTPPQVYEDVSSIGGRFAFSPGGSQLAYTDEQEQSRIVRVDGSAEPEFLTNWPDWWAHNFWPQWDGEEATTAPTLIPVSSADQARAFAEPILAAIADRPPDFEDDFGDQASGWSIGSNDDGDEWGYENEAYSILVAPGYRDAGVPPDYPLELSDFVLEVDGQFVSGEWGHWYVSFRHSLGSIEQPASAGDYAVKFYPDSSFDLWKNVGETSRELIRETAVYAPTFEQGTGMNRLTIIAQGPQIAIYMNGEPLCFVRDESLKKGTILLAATNETNDTPLRVHFDNLKVWDISDLELPSAETTPAPQPTAAPIPTRTPVPVGQCRIAYEQGGDVYVRNCDGSGVLRLTDRPAGDWLPAWSPDGTQIVFCSDHHAIGEGRNQLYMMDADGSNLTRLTNTESNDEHPSWSPDGSRIAFHSGCALAVINADGANRTTLVEARDDLCVGFPTWSPDSRRIAFRSLVSSGDTGFYQHDIYVVDDGGSGILKLASFTSEERGQYVVWSPDGSRVAFDILLDGQWKYYAVNSDGSEEPVEIASIPDSWYSWYWPQWGGE